MKKKSYKKSDIIYHIVKRWRLILFFTVLGLVVGLTMNGISIIRGEMSKEFKIRSSIAVVAVDEEGQYSSERGIPTKSDTEMAREMTDSALYIIKSQRNIETVISTMGIKGVSVRDIKSNLSASRYGDTEIIELTLLWRSEREGLDIMNAINKVTDQTMLDTLHIGRISVIDYPKASFISGGNIGGMSTWALIGFLVGLMLCIAKWLFEPTIINDTEVESLFGVTSLGSVPFDAKYAATKPMYESDLAIRDDIKSVTHLLINQLNLINANKLYITSSVHEEGKTRLVADIALHLANLGKRTLLIDCDMNNPVLGTLFYDELPYEKTLNAMYRGDSDSLDAISHINGCLDILPMILERNPETFNDALIHVLNGVTEGYDYVLIDAAPVGTDAEVLRLNEVADTVLFVVRFDKAKTEIIRSALMRIAKSGIPIVGCAFNYVVNWKQTIFNTPKRVRNALFKELKKRNKNSSKKQKEKKSADK